MRHFITALLILSTLLQAVLGEAVVVEKEEEQQQQQERFDETGEDVSLELSSRDNSAIYSDVGFIAKESSTKEQESEKEQLLEVSTFIDESSTLGFWPFSKKNASNNDDDDSTATTSNNNNNKTESHYSSSWLPSSSSSCYSYVTCSECTEASSWCHWCDSDHVCHAKASVYGCFSGSTCKNASKHDDKDKATGCASHATCSECTLSSSHVCHWCAHDNACHAIGSYYGCMQGVDCYSNDRCQRLNPEPIISSSSDGDGDQKHLIPEIGPLPVAVIVSVAALMGCCMSMCFCFASGVKGAYDDLVLVDNDVIALEQQQQQLDTDPPPQFSEQEPSTLTNIVNEDEVVEHDDSNDAGNGTDYVRMPDEEEQAANDVAQAQESMPLIYSEHQQPQQQQQRQRRRPRRVQRLYNFCSLCYVGSLIAIGGFAYGAYKSLPLVPPSYNVCNEESSWKSLIESMSTDFQILVSVANPNHFSLALDMASGNFTHKGKPVGSFQIPPVVAEPLSITDVLLVAHFAPEKWDAISITREFVSGKLEFLANAKATLRIPILFDYSITASKKDIVIHVNELSDRSLCACPDWKQAKNPTLPPLPFL